MCPEVWLMHQLYVLVKTVFQYYQFQIPSWLGMGFLVYFNYLMLVPCVYALDICRPCELSQYCNFILYQSHSIGKSQFLWSHPPETVAVFAVFLHFLLHRFLILAMSSLMKASHSMLNTSKVLILNAQCSFRSLLISIY